MPTPITGNGGEPYTRSTDEMSRQQGRTLAEITRLGQIVKTIEPGKTIGIAMPDKFITISAETYPERDEKLEPFDCFKIDDEIGSIPDEEWERMKKLFSGGRP